MADSGSAPCGTAGSTASLGRSGGPDGGRGCAIMGVPMGARADESLVQYFSRLRPGQVFRWRRCRLGRIYRPHGRSDRAIRLAGRRPTDRWMAGYRLPTCDPRHARPTAPATWLRPWPAARRGADGRRVRGRRRGRRSGVGGQGPPGRRGRRPDQPPAVPPGGPCGAGRAPCQPGPGRAGGSDGRATVPPGDGAGGGPVPAVGVAARRVDRPADGRGDRAANGVGPWRPCTRPATSTAT